MDCAGCEEKQVGHCRDYENLVDHCTWINDARVPERVLSLPEYVGFEAQRILLNDLSSNQQYGQRNVLNERKKRKQDFE